MQGVHWIVDAHGCEPSALRDRRRLEALFARCVAELALTPVSDAVWHTFPEPGGITGLLPLAESHLACHSFPEHGSLCLDLFCCRPRGAWDVAGLLTSLLGATHVDVRCLERRYEAKDLADATLAAVAQVRTDRVR